MGIVMTPEKTWDYAFGVVRVVGLEPTEEFKELAKKEADGEITKSELRSYLESKYKVKVEDNDIS